MAARSDIELELGGAQRWPHYRIRRGIRAKRIAHPFILHGHIYQDGYIVRMADGDFAVLTRSDFEAVNELTESYD
jgi:hypothetical protein